MKKLVKSMATLVMVAGVVGFMGCKQPTTPESKPLPPGLKILPSGTDGTFGTKGIYVEFGIWPQTKYSGEAGLTQCTEGINAWPKDVCFTDGTDNYIKVTAAPYYEKDSDNDPTKPETKYKFDDGTPIDNGAEYYFKLEPIQWRVLTNDYKIPDGKNDDGTNKYKSSGKKLLFAEKALAASCFYKDSKNRGTDPEIFYPNNYKESDIRNYLNSDFIKKAFTPAEIENIIPTVVDNSWQSTFGTGEESKAYYKEHNNACENTTDKIFLLSEKEATTAEFGFDAYDAWGEDSTRIRKTTDYARATGAGIGSGVSINNSYFWLRSPSGSDYNYVRYVISRGGYTEYFYNVVNTEVGVVPALTMDF